MYITITTYLAVRSSSSCGSLGLPVTETRPSYQRALRLLLAALRRTLGPRLAFLPHGIETFLLLQQLFPLLPVTPHTFTLMCKSLVCYDIK
jgi:hypothetical protein